MPCQHGGTSDGGNATTCSCGNTNWMGSDCNTCSLSGEGVIADTCECDTVAGYTKRGTKCVKDFPNIDIHPANNTPSNYVTTEFNKGNFLEQINAQYAYARGYNGYIADRDKTTGELISNESTTEKIKVGVLDTGVDITHPDLIDNVVKDGTGKPYGYNFDYGRCKSGDTTHCYGILSTDGNKTGMLVFYKTGADDYDIITDGIYSYSSLSSYLSNFQYYNSSYDWDAVQNDPSPHNTSENTTPDETNTNDADHGTHIAGIIAASANGVGLRGVASSAEIVAAVQPNFVSMVDGNWINNAYTLTYQAFADEGVRVINKSWGQYSTSDPETWASYAAGKDATDVDMVMVDAYKLLAQKKIVSVVAAGNDGNDKQPSLDNGIPLTKTFGKGSSYDLTNLFITVVAADKNNKLASYSDICGATKEYCITAPGGDVSRGAYTLNSEYEDKLNTSYAAYMANPTYQNYVAYSTLLDKYNTAYDNLYKEWDIYSTVQNDSRHSAITEGTGSNKGAYGFMRGTSMAAPVVTGSVALLMSAYPHLSSQEIVEILFRSANKVLPGWGEKDYLFDEINGIVITDTITIWKDSFGNPYEVSSVYGHGMVDLKAAIEPLGELETPISQSVDTKIPIASTRLRLPNLISGEAGNSIPASVLGLDDYNRPYTTSIAGRIKHAPRNPNAFKRDFRSFMFRNKIQTAGKKDKLSFAFSSARTDRNLMGWGIMDMNYQFNDIAALKLSYRSDTLNENSIIDKALSNPFMNMRDSYSISQQLKWKDLAFTFGTTFGKNAFYETDDNKDDEFKKSVHAFNTELAYHANKYLTLKVIGGLLREEESLLGINGTGIFETDDGETYYTGATLEYQPIVPLTLSASYYYGQSSIPKTKALVRIDNVISDSFAFDARYQYNDRDILGLQFSSPLRVRQGSAFFNLPIARDLYRDEVYFTQKKISLKPNAREYDLGLYYLTETDNYDWRGELMARFHPDHISGIKPDYRALFSLSLKY